MQQTELKQCADFLSIALESLEAGSHDVAIDFIQDVADALPDVNQQRSLEGAIEFIEDGNITDAIDTIEQVNAELLQDIDSL